MQENLDNLRKQHEELESRIRDQEVRIPPHSVRPHQIEELERLEDLRDQLEERIRDLEGRSPS